MKLSLVFDILLPIIAHLAYGQFKNMHFLTKYGHCDNLLNNNIQSSGSLEVVVHAHTCIFHAVSQLKIIFQQ